MILAEPKVVILDEATSALDAATEYALHQALGDFEGRTTLIVAHRLSAVKQADRVLVRWRAYRRRRRPPATDRRRRPLRPALRTSATDVRRQAVAWRFFSYIPYKTSGFYWLRQ